MAQTPGAAYRNYNRIPGNTNETKYVCYGPAGTGVVLRGRLRRRQLVALQHGLERVVRLRHRRRQMRRLRDALGRLPLHAAMMTTPPLSQAHLAPGDRSHRSRALPWARAIAAAIADLGSSASAAKADPAPPGTAASQLSVLRDGPIAQSPPRGVSAGFDGGSADTDGRAPARSERGRSRSRPVRRGARQRRCVQRARQRRRAASARPASTTSRPSGITPRAPRMRRAGLLYGFAADDVVGVDVVAGRQGTAGDDAAGTPIVADLGAARPERRHGAHRASRRRHDRDTVANDLRAPGS